MTFGPNRPERAHVTIIDMDVLVTRHGGFTDSPERLGPSQIATLPRPQAARIAQIITHIGFFDLPTDLNGALTHDGLTFVMSVVDGDRRHRVTWHPSGDDPRIAGLREVVELLEDGGVKWHLAPRATADPGASPSKLPWLRRQVRTAG